MHDVILVGAGPIGLATAIALRLCGLDVVVFERRSLAAPLDKACGEGLMPGAVAVLERLGVAQPAGVPFVGIRYVDKDVVARGHFRGNPGLGVRRTALHRVLLARARELNVPIEQVHVRNVSQRPGGVQVEDSHARWLVAADGLHSGIRRHLQPAMVHSGTGRLGIRRHCQVDSIEAWVDVYWHAQCEAYVTPVGPHEVGVAILHNERGLRFEELLTRFPHLQARLGPSTSTAMGAGPFWVRMERPRKHNVLFIGDAAAFPDPITGEGLMLGFLAAEQLAYALAHDRPEHYERAWQRLTNGLFGWCGALLWLRRSPVLRRGAITLLNHMPRTFSSLLRVATSPHM